MGDTGKVWENQGFILTGADMACGTMWRRCRVVRRLRAGPGEAKVRPFIGSSQGKARQGGGKRFRIDCEDWLFE